MIKVIQISDCHISSDPGAIYRGVNPRAEFEKLLPEVRKWQPNLVLATGDLAEDASREAYHYLSEQLATLGTPVLTIPGNHDEPALQRETFAVTPRDLPIAVLHRGWQLILLNTAKPGKIGGLLTKPEIRELECLLAENKLPVLVVLHYQPVSTASPWIDRFDLLKPDEFWDCLEGSNNVRAVLWGHIHHDFSDQRKGVKLLGAPSTAANSLAKQEKFTPDQAGPACRWLELGAQGQVETGILRVQN